MAWSDEERKGGMTRREVLAGAAMGVVAASVGSVVGAAEGLVGPGVAGKPGTSGSGAASVHGRVRESFDFGWRFLQADAVGAQMPEFADGAWREVDLPHDWSIEGTIAETEPSGGMGAYLPTGVGWYRKKFRVDAAERGRVATLEFDGVYQNSEVWINGVYLGLRPYGFVPFAYELTPHLKYGAENVIAVKVDNSRQTNCRWYSGSGIYRHTWLLMTDALRVGYWGTQVTTTRVSKASAIVEVKTRVANGGRTAAACSLITDLLDAGGKVVVTADASQAIGAGDEYEFVQRMTVANPGLWSTATPTMYRVRSTVGAGGQMADEYETPFGMREAVFDARRGFVLNGERVKLNGVCLHQDAGCVGSAVPERMWERRLGLLKEMGCNAIRTSHNPYAAEFLDLCDRMGFLVMNEAFDEWKIGKAPRSGYHLYFDEWYERDLLNFIHRDRNHPSMVLWSAGNEVPDQSDKEGAETLRKLLKVFHTEDPTRPVTVACDCIAADPPSSTVRPEFLAELDVVGYNYVDRWRERAQLYYSEDHDAFPERRVIGTESSGTGGTRGDYAGLVGSAALSTERAGRPNRAAPSVDTEQLWKFVGSHDYVSGDFMWTGIDYLGEARWPAKGSSAGVIDTCGFRKDGFYFYQSQWTEKPMLHVFPHWSWKGREGQFIPVICYTDCDSVELFLNGRSVGVRSYEFPRYGMQGHYGNYAVRGQVPRTTSDLHLAWDVPYEAGVLRAVGTKDGAVAMTTEIATTGDAAAIRLTADRTEMNADRMDVVHLTVEIVDAQGRMVPDAALEVLFEVQGEGRLIGVDNGDPRSHEGYKVNRRSAFHGMCLGVVQATAKEGVVRVTASAAGLAAGVVTVTSKG